MWSGLTPGQGTVMGALLTGIFTIIGIVIGVGYFNGKIKSLEGAVKASDETINKHLTRTSSSVEEMVKGLEEKVAKRLSDVNGALADITEKVDAIALVQADEAQDRLAETEQSEGLGEDSGDIVEAGARAASGSKDDVRRMWTEIQTAIERVANSEHLDGRRRARYNRIDRRSYGSVIDALERDGNLPVNAAQAARSAYAIRNSLRGRSADPLPDIVRTMGELSATVLSSIGERSGPPPA